MLWRKVTHPALFLVLLLAAALAPAAPAAGAAPAAATPSGQPQDSGVQLLSSAAGGVTFEVKVPWERMSLEPVTAGGKDYVRVSLPGWAATAQPGAPLLPILVEAIGVPFGAVLSVHAEPGAAHTMALPAAALPVATQRVEWEPAAAAEGDPALPMPILTIEEDPAIYAGTAAYPGALARVTNDGVLRQQRVAGISAYPVQYDPASRELRVYESLRVEVRFASLEGRVSTGAPAAESPEYEQLFRQSLLNYEAARAWRQTVAISSPLPAGGTEGGGDEDPWTPPVPGWRIKVRADGMYQLTYAELLTAGVPVTTSLPCNTFQVFNLGSEVAIHIGDQDGDGTFEDTDFLAFYGQAVVSKYARDNVYWLTYGQGTGLRMASRSGAPGAAGTPDYYMDSLQMEGNAAYLPGLPGTEDLERWLWAQIVASGGNPKTWSYPFSLGQPYSEAGMLTVTLWGNVAYAGSPDHHVRLLVNGTQVGDDVSWDGKAWQTVERVVPAGLLTAGANTISVVVVNDGSQGIDIVYVDRMELEFANTFLAMNNALAFSYDAPGTWRFEVEGFSSDQLVVYDVTSPTVPVTITGVVTYPSGVTFTGVFTDVVEVSQPKAYWATASDGYAVEQGIEQDRASTLRTPANGADHIIIAHEDFGPQAEQLRAWRQSHGLRAMSVDVQDVYDEFSYGLLAPAAIHDFLAYTYDNWVLPRPSFVVLLGDGSYDPKDYQNRQQVTDIPAFLAGVDPWINETAADNRYVTLTGGDTMPDMMIGRLAVTNGIEATTFVNKIIASESMAGPPAGWRLQVLAVTDNDEPGNPFPTISDSVLTDTLRSPYTVDKVYLGIDPYTVPADARAAIMAGINAGKLIVNYIGHAATTSWGGTNETLFASSDVTNLTNMGMYPVMLPMTCWEGYYINPTPKLGQNAAAELVTRAENKGAVASWSPTGLGLASGHDHLDRGFLEKVFEDPDGLITLGEATIAGKLKLWASGFNLDLLDTYLLFGDPGTVLEIAEALCDPISNAALNWTPTSPLVNQVVSFSGSASGTEPISYDWDFGDGGTGSGASPTHSYTAAGDYVVTVTASNACGSQVVQDTVTVGNSVHLSSMVMFSREARTGAYLVIVQGVVHDQDHNPLAGVTVTGNWTLPNGTVIAGTSAASSANGAWKITTIKPQAGLYQMDITGMSVVGYTYNADDNDTSTHRETIVP